MDEDEVLDFTNDPTPGVSETFTGTDADEAIEGRGRDDVLSGMGGADILLGRNGHDDLSGGGGDDYLFGGNGRDRLFGGEGEDTLEGGNGDDTFVLDGDLTGSTLDTIVDFDVNRDLRAMNFNDAIELNNVGGLDIIVADVEGEAHIYFGAELVAIVQSSSGSQLPEGGSLAEAVLNAIVVIGVAPDSLEVGDPPTSGPGPDIIPDETLDGTEGDDLISGGDADEEIYGYGGDDILYGRNGHDYLDGGDGDDYLFGGNGRDRLFGGTGNDILEGGNGDDTFIFDADLAGESLDTVIDFDVENVLRNMIYNDSVEILNASGITGGYRQAGDEVELVINGELMAVFQGSGGEPLLAETLLANTSFLGGDVGSFDLLL
ncbi:MAG: hypothetical protein VYD90_20350 [Pseudomonadota bacterium]|nr:hypothetical protein [Pseudomonadota bacterium]